MSTTTQIRPERYHPAFISEAVHEARGVVMAWMPNMNCGLIGSDVAGYWFFFLRKDFAEEDRGQITVGLPVIFSAVQQHVPEGDRRPRVKSARMIAVNEGNSGTD